MLRDVAACSYPGVGSKARRGGWFAVQSLVPVRRPVQGRHLIPAWADDGRDHANIGERLSYEHLEVRFKPSLLIERLDGAGSAALDGEVRHRIDRRRRIFRIRSCRIVHAEDLGNLGVSAKGVDVGGASGLLQSRDGRAGRRAGRRA